MREEDIPKTAITTLLGLLEWVVIPQGIRNAPAVQQCQINEALQGLTGECCEAYVDDIIIWGKNAKDLHDNIFPIPTCSQQLHSFLGLVNYLHDFVPNLATHTAVLHAALPLNTAVEKAYYKAVKMHKGHLPDSWTGWTWSFGPAEQAAFEAVRCAVSTVPCLTVIDYDAVKAGTQQVFLFTDASNTGTGAWIGVAPGVTVQEHDSYQLLLVDNHLCIPDTDNLHENLMCQAHEGTAAHLGLEKTLEVLRNGYFWDTMSKDTHEFVCTCHSCQQANASMKKPAGPLHPLPILCDKFDDITMDFVGPLPSSGGYDYLLTITDHLTGFIELVPCATTINARDLAVLVWDKWVSRYGLPLSITSDRDTLFTSRFWTALWEKQNVKLKMSTAFHPQTDAYKVGDWVWLDTQNRLKEFRAGDGEFRAAKFFPCFQGPYQVQEANPTLSVYRLHMNDKTYPKFHGHLLKPYLAAPCFHQTSPLIPTPHSNSSPPSNSQHRRILQILDDRHHQGCRQLRVVLPGDGPNGHWWDLDELRAYEGFQGLYEEYMGDDELAL
ncbi:hypothetical protein D1P53_001896 [Cryptococcus gattii VGV]|nr:hypothetical protein D1P53_001896 [Cryptococcus gattii VGV]